MKNAGRRLCGALCAVVMMAAAAEASAETLVCTVASGQYVNVRDRDSTKAGTYGKIHRGDEIEPSAITDGWATITFNGNTAYVQTQYFEAAADVDCVVEANGRVRYRDAVDGDVVGFYAVGDAVHVDAWAYGKDGTRWARCGGVWVKAEFLREVAATE